MTRVAAIGECMIEFRAGADGRYTRAFGGDTLNTALYLARLGVAADYLTVLGDDPFSAEMIAAWRAEGIGTGLVSRLPGRMPGLYTIETDARGERRFSYWRDRAPARDLFADAACTTAVAALSALKAPAHTFVTVPAAHAAPPAPRPAYDLIYLSVITLSLYCSDGRTRLLAALDAARANGARVALDTNFRPRGWPGQDEAKSALRAALRRADIVFASTEDLALLFGASGEAELAACHGSAEIVVKRDGPSAGISVDISLHGERWTVPAPAVNERPVDTTAAGDSFAAAYLAARFAGAAPPDAARAGHRLAGVVIDYPGAIIPCSAMPVLPELGAARALHQQEPPA